MRSRVRVWIHPVFFGVVWIHAVRICNNIQHVVKSMQLWTQDWKCKESVGFQLLYSAAVNDFRHMVSTQNYSETWLQKTKTCTETIKQAGKVPGTKQLDILNMNITTNNNRSNIYTPKKLTSWNPWKVSFLERGTSSSIQLLSQKTNDTLSTRDREVLPVGTRSRGFVTRITGFGCWTKGGGVGLPKVPLNGPRRGWGVGGANPWGWKRGWLLKLTSFIVFCGFRV